MAASGNTTFTVQFALLGSTAGVRNATLTTYQAWANGAAFGADANGDGVSNGLAFLLGAADPNADVTLPTPVENNGDLVLAFSCLKDANRGGAKLFVEHSGDTGTGDTWDKSRVWASSRP